MKLKTACSAVLALSLLACNTAPSVESPVALKLLLSQAGIYRLTIPPSGGGGDDATGDLDITNTSGTILTTIMHNCETTGGWLSQTQDLSAYAGQTVRVEFLVHQNSRLCRILAGGHHHLHHKQVRSGR